MRVLVVDHNRDELDRMDQILENQAGIDYRLCDRPDQALTLLNKGEIDCLLLDIHMPAMDGLQMIQKVRELQGGTWLPTLFMASAEDVKSRGRALRAQGVPLVEALGSAAGAAGNRLYYDAIKLIQDDVATGQQLQFSMRASGLFPNMVVQMVSIGEESGALDEMLHKAANHYEEAVDNSVDNLTSLMEPMIMSFLGVVIGGLVIAMYLPIFQMGSVV